MRVILIKAFRFLYHTFGMKEFALHLDRTEVKHPEMPRTSIGNVLLK